MNRLASGPAGATLMIALVVAAALSSVHADDDQRDLMRSVTVDELAYVADEDSADKNAPGKAAAPAKAARQPSWLDHLTIRIDVGVDYVTNETLPRNLTTDPTARRDADDARFRIQADIGYCWNFEGGKRLSIGYQFYQTLHTKQDDVDLQGHTFHGRFDWALNPGLRIGVDAAVSHWLLQRASFLRRYGAGADVFFHEWGDLWGRVDYHFSYNDYPFDSQQNADNHDVTVSQVYYLPDGRSYVSAGYTFTRSGANAMRWRYDGHRVFASASIWLDPLDNIAAGISFSWDGYDGPDPIALVPRDDKMFSVSVRYNRVLCKHVSVYIGIGWRNVNSNVSRQDYGSATISAGVVIEF